MPQRPRYPSPSAIVHMVLRALGIVVNIIFFIFLGRLAEVYHLTYPAAYVAACWAVCTDALEIGILLNKSRSFPRLSGGRQLTLDLIGVFLLVPAAFLNWYFSSPPHGRFRPTAAEKEANKWATDAPWVGCACLVLRLIISVAVCVDSCTSRRRRY